jgi:uncharacterized OB-fold protein
MAESWAAKLWHLWANGTLAFQHCTSCQLAQHPPGPVCNRCHATTLEFRPVSGTGTLVAWSKVHRAPSAAFAADLPYTLAIVQLSEGALVEARVPDDAAEETWVTGADVSLALEEIVGRSMPVAEVAIAREGVSP